MSRGQTAAVAAAAVAVVTMLYFWRRRRRLPRGPRVLSVYPSRVSGRPWYRAVVITDVSTQHGCSANEAVRALHLGSADNIPESVIRIRRDAPDEPWKPVATALLKPHLHPSLLAFAWLEDGFAPGGRAALIGVAGGSLLHFWRDCVPGGLELQVDAVELDGAVVEAAREHLGLSCCEPPNGHVSIHVADGASFLQECEDEAYDLLVVDLDMGALVQKGDGGATAPHPAAANAIADGALLSGAAETKAAGGERKAGPVQSDPTRDMYRALSERGVLVINEYSEEPPAVRLESSIRLVRLLRRFFPQVHQIRTTTHHNTMFIAAVDEKAKCDAAELAERAARCSARLGLGGIDLGELLRKVPGNRHQVYS
jgi:hypothetical protein